MSTIPVRCFSCGKVLGDLMDEYTHRVQEETPDVINEENERKFDKNFKGKILDDLKITRPCCRAQMLSTIENNIYSLNK